MENNKKDTSLAFGLLVGGMAALAVSVVLNLAQIILRKSTNPAMLAISLSYAAATFLTAGIKSKKIDHIIVGVATGIGSLMYIAITISKYLA